MTGEVLTACDSGQCLNAVQEGNIVRIWDDAAPSAVVFCTAAAWQQWQDKARAEERAAIVAGLRNIDRSVASRHFAIASAKYYADLIEVGDE